jgi:hypothetical protein
MNLSVLPGLAGLVFGRPDGAVPPWGEGGLVNGEIESVKTLFSLMKNSDKDAGVKVDKYCLPSVCKQPQPI